MMGELCRLLKFNPKEKDMAKKVTSSAEVHSAAKTLGARGGKKGGPARANVLSSGERSKIAAKGGRARHK